jgi:hypothetical protein
MKTSFFESKTCPFITCAHPHLTQILGQIQAKISCPNPTPMHSLFDMDRANKSFECSKNNFNDDDNQSWFSEIDLGSINYH